MDSERDDEELEEELRRVAAQVDPVPPDALRQAVAGFAWRTIGTDLAELAFDSLVDAGQAALVRGGGEPRSLTFRATALSIEVEITCQRGSCAVVGQLMPAQPATLEIRHKGGTVTTEADDLGRFSARSLPTGPLSFRCLTGTGTAQAAVVTDWIAV